MEIRSEGAILNKDICDASILDGFMGKHTLTTFQTHSIVITVKITSSDNDTITCVEVNGITAWSSHRFTWSLHLAVFHQYIVALIEMGCPKGRVDQTHTSKCDFIRPPYKDQTRTMDLKISPFPALLACRCYIIPKALPKFQAIAIDSAGACQFKAIHMISID